MLETCGSGGRGRTFPKITRRLSSMTGAPTPVGKVRPMLTVVPGATGGDDSPANGGSSLIDEIDAPRVWCRSCCLSPSPGRLEGLIVA
jgi:hypothetical protein